jgi:hypothetical protein
MTSHSIKFEVSNNKLGLALETQGIGEDGATGAVSTADAEGEIRGGYLVGEFRRRGADRADPDTGLIGRASAGGVDNVGGSPSVRAACNALGVSEPIRYHRGAFLGRGRLRCDVHLTRTLGSRTGYNIFTAMFVRTIKTAPSRGSMPMPNWIISEVDAEHRACR